MIHRLMVPLAALSVLAAPALAQEHRIGFHGGVSFATLGGDGADELLNKENRTGFMVGAFAEIGLSRHVALSPEVSYVQRGVKGTDQGTPVELKLKYVQVPVLLKIVVPLLNSPVRPHFYAGPSIAFRSSCDLEVGNEESACDDPDIEVDFKKADFAVIGGAGVDIGPVFVSLRYDLGLSNLDDDPSSQDRPIRNRAFSAVAGVTIPLGGR